MKKNIYILSFFLYANTYAQIDNFEYVFLSISNKDTLFYKTIDPKFGTLKFQFEFDSINSSDEYSNDSTSYFITLFDSAENKIIQQITDTVGIPLHLSSVGLVDINFDNYLDLYFRNSWDMRDSFGLEFWLYDSLSHRYNYNNILSEEFYSGTQINKNDKKLRNQYFHWASRSTYTYTYSIINNKPLVTKIVFEEQINLSDTTHVLIKELINGKLTITKDSIYVK